MAWVRKGGRISRYSKALLCRARSMGLDGTSGMTALITKETGKAASALYDSRGCIRALRYFHPGAPAMTNKYVAAPCGGASRISYGTRIHTLCFH